MRSPKTSKTEVVFNPSKSKFWLLKSEPDAFSWDQLVARGAKGEPWGGVRNYLARNNMRAMKLGDLGFFYHSNIGKEIVGILKIIALAHPEAEETTGTWECVDVAAVAAMPKTVPLADIKANPELASMALVKTSRLSVQPVTRAEWEEVCRMGGLDMKALDTQSVPFQKPIKQKSVPKQRAR